MTARLVKIAGYAVLIFSVLFLAHRFNSNISTIAAIKLGPDFYLVLIAVCAGYGVFQFFIVGGLCAVLRGFGARSPTFRRVLIFHGRTNIAKYIPGNVFHFAGRQILARSFGWPQAVVGLTSIAETILVALGAGLSAMGFAAFTETDALEIFTRLVSPSVYISVGAGIAFLWIISTQASLIPYFSRFQSVAKIQEFARSAHPAIALLQYIIFFLSGGILFWVLSAALSGQWQAQHIAMAGFAYVASWLAGYMSPGAPGGIGVREAALVLLLGSSIGEAHALLLGVGLRVVTTFGDFFLLALALLFRPETPKQETP